VAESNNHRPTPDGSLAKPPAAKVRATNAVAAKPARTQAAAGKAAASGRAATGSRRVVRNGAGAGAGGAPARSRELRAQGKRTMRKLFDAGMKVFAERGYHAARVDDIVRAARTSHGTFYLYFANKEDLLRSLAVDCAAEMNALADGLGPIGPDADGLAELRRFLEGFLGTYRRYGPVIRAWMEGQVDDREVNRLGVDAFTQVANALGRRIEDADPEHVLDGPAAVSALMAMLERFNYAVASRPNDVGDAQVLETLALVIHRGFFGATVTPQPSVRP
jgi:AcrR family transcriptional regulator